MITVGITGGIGSGKSTVCKVFESFEIPIYYADLRAKELMIENEQIKIQLESYFGEKVYFNGQLNRSFLAQKIFNNHEALQFINSIVHPAVGDDFIQWTQRYSNIPYVLEEAALLFESGSYKKMDVLITVTCPEELRIKRVMERDNISRDEVIQRLNNQLKEGDKVRLSDYIIVNDGQHSIIDQVNEVHKKILDTM